jgi:hypothetical protein
MGLFPGRGKGAGVKRPAPSVTVTDPPTIRNDLQRTVVGGGWLLLLALAVFRTVFLPGVLWSAWRVWVGQAVVGGLLLVLALTVGSERTLPQDAQDASVVSVSLPPRVLLEEGGTEGERGPQVPRSHPPRSTPPAPAHRAPAPSQTNDDDDARNPTGRGAAPLRARPALPTLHQDIHTRYAPGPDGSPAGMVRAGTAYTITARYGWEWVQADLGEHGVLWSQREEMGIAALSLAALPNLSPTAPYRTLLPAAMTRPGEYAPRLPRDAAAHFAPGAGGAVARDIAAGTPYDLVARYGWDWLQADFAGYGVFWVWAEDVGVGEDGDLSPLPDLALVAGYRLHIVAEGETLAHLAEGGGSEPSIIRHYNRVQEPLVPGRPLIIPFLQGYPTTLPRQAVLVRRGSSALPCVALTVDVERGDIGPLLHVLREGQTRMTFFVTGA